MRAAKHYRQLLSIDFNIEALAFVLDPTAHAAGASTSWGARSATGPAWSSTFRRRSARGWRWTATARPISMQCCTWRTPIISNGATHEAPKLRHAARRCRAGRLVVASPAWAELRGEVVRIIDGDTIDVLVDKQPVRVRLVDIDAPEKRQAFGERARQALAGMVFRRHVWSTRRTPTVTAARWAPCGSTWSWPAGRRSRATSTPRWFTRAWRGPIASTAARPTLKCCGSNRRREASASASGPIRTPSSRGNGDARATTGGTKVEGRPHLPARQYGRAES